MSIKVSGLDTALRAMSKIASGEPVKRASTRYSIRVKSWMQNYPPALSPDWRRTGNLGRKWYANTGTGKIEFGNTAPYAGWVQGPDRAPGYGQVWWHKRTGWRQIDKIAEDNYEFFKKSLADEFSKLV